MINKKTPQKHIETASTKKMFDSSATDTNIAVIVLLLCCFSLQHAHARHTFQINLTSNDALSKSSLTTTINSALSTAQSVPSCDV